jgi:hypothetical protein
MAKRKRKDDQNEIHSNYSNNGKLGLATDLLHYIWTFLPFPNTLRNVCKQWQTDWHENLWKLEKVEFTLKWEGLYNIVPSIDCATAIATQSIKLKGYIANVDIREFAQSHGFTEQKIVTHATSGHNLHCLHDSEVLNAPVCSWLNQNSILVPHEDDWQFQQSILQHTSDKSQINFLSSEIIELRHCVQSQLSRIFGHNTVVNPDQCWIKIRPKKRKNWELCLYVIPNVHWLWSELARSNVTDLPFTFCRSELLNYVDDEVVNHVDFDGDRVSCHICNLEPRIRPIAFIQTLRIELLEPTHLCGLGAFVYLQHLILKWPSTAQKASWSWECELQDPRVCSFKLQYLQTLVLIGFPNFDLKGASIILKSVFPALHCVYLLKCSKEATLTPCDLSIAALRNLPLYKCNWIDGSECFFTEYCDEHSLGHCFHDFFVPRLPPDKHPIDHLLL